MMGAESPRQFPGTNETHDVLKVILCNHLALFFFSKPCSGHVELPGPGIKPWPEIELEPKQ